MAEPNVLLEVRIAGRYEPTGATRHLSGSLLPTATGHLRGSLLPTPAALRIVTYEGAPGFSLLYLDADGAEQTDTWHQTLEDALHQATHEFRVPKDAWTTPSGGKQQD